MTAAYIALRNKLRASRAHTNKIVGATFVPSTQTATYMGDITYYYYLEAHFPPSPNKQTTHVRTLIHNTGLERAVSSWMASAFCIAAALNSCIRGKGPRMPKTPHQELIRSSHRFFWINLTESLRLMIASRRYLRYSANS